MQGLVGKKQSKSGRIEQVATSSAPTATTEQTATSSTPATKNSKGKQQRKRPSCLIDHETEPNQDSSAPKVENDINCSVLQATQPSQDNGIKFMPTPGRMLRSRVRHEEDVVLRPRVTLEVTTRLRMRQHAQIKARIRSINFTGDHNGVSVPIDLPYSAPTLQWKGKTTVNAN
uniref:Uncharacterized protein LOC104243835 isoform X2 n=1 Tax=Nicotiana sylvestris TaxID=4096 RepID=A0A1U7Y609_NICSY|nr:PREDICTED: uncharacterized protein LOC104243835 isoform X2 [Nicotiana sylvestris]